MFEDDVDRIPEDPMDPAVFESVFLASVAAPPPLIDRLTLGNARARTLEAERLEHLDGLRLEIEAETGASWTDPDSLAWRSLRAEVATALEVHERTAQSLLDLARRLVHVFPATLDGLRTAQFSERHARILVEQSTGIPEELLPEYEARLLPYAARLVPARFERMARTLREALAPEGMIERHREALTMRATGLEPGPDGMVWYGGYLAAEDGVRAKHVVRAIALTLKDRPGDTRTLAQIEADVFRDLLVDPAGLVPPAEEGGELQPSPRAQHPVSPTVFVHIPALTALGRSNAFGILEEYGPIDADTARKLAGESKEWTRILTDPETGVIVKYGRVKYRVTDPARQKLRIRDGVCRFVGCTRPAVSCDLDHTVAWEDGGHSDDCNLAYLCRAHHRLKHGSPWKVSQDGDGSGTLTWTSPKGHVRRTYADTVLPPPARSRGPGAGVLVQQEWLTAAAAPPPF